MVTLKIDTVEIGVLAAAIDTLKENINTSNMTWNSGNCCGNTVDEIMNLIEQLKCAKVELKNLMEATVNFLNSVQITFDAADKREASSLLVNAGIGKKVGSTANSSIGGGFR